MTTCYSDTKTIYKTSILNSQSVTSGTKLCTHEHVEIHIYNPIFVRTFKKDNHTFLSSPSQLTPLPQSQTKPNSNVKTRFYPSVWTVFKDVGNSQYGGLDRLDYCNSVLIRSNKNPQSTELQGSSQKQKLRAHQSSLGFPLLAPCPGLHTRSITHQCIHGNTPPYLRELITQRDTTNFLRSSFLHIQSS